MRRTRDDDAAGRPPPEPPGGRLRIRDLVAATPASRNRYVDLLRALAILMVVVGHWVVSAVTVEDGRLGWVNLLWVLPWTHPVTWVFQVMPVVFLVGGYANAASWAAHRGRGGSAASWVQARALRLLRPTAAFVVTLVVGYGTALALGADRWVTRTSVWLAAISLWFLVVYLAVVSLGPLLFAWHRRWGLAGLLPLVGVVALGDAARLLTGSAAPAAASYLVAWAAVHQLGVAWHSGSLTRSRWIPVTFSLGGLAALVALTVPGPYAVTMVGGAPPPTLENTAPPTLALLALAVAQTGVVLLLRHAADRWLLRPRVWRGVVAVNAVALTIYLWHTVPIVIAGTTLVADGVFPQSEVGSGEWFALRVPWLLILAVLLLGLVAVTARWERRTSALAPAEPSPVVVGLGVAACLGGLAGLGVGGPDGFLPSVEGVPVTELTLFAAGIVALSRGGHAR